MSGAFWPGPERHRLYALVRKVLERYGDVLRDYTALLLCLMSLRKEMRKRKQLSFKQLRQLKALAKADFTKALRDLDKRVLALIAERGYITHQDLLKVFSHSELTRIKKRLMPTCMLFEFPISRDERGTILPDDECMYLAGALSPFGGSWSIRLGHLPEGVEHWEDELSLALFFPLRFHAHCTNALKALISAVSQHARDIRMKTREELSLLVKQVEAFANFVHENSLAIDDGLKEELEAQLSLLVRRASETS